MLKNIFPPVGFKGNLSLPFFFFFFSRGLNHFFRVFVRFPLLPAESVCAGKPSRPVVDDKAGGSQQGKLCMTVRESL